MNRNFFQRSLDLGLCKLSAPMNELQSLSLECTQSRQHHLVPFWWDSFVNLSSKLFAGISLLRTLPWQRCQGQSHSFSKEGVDFLFQMQSWWLELNAKLRDDIDLKVAEKQKGSKIWGYELVFLPNFSGSHCLDCDQKGALIWPMV